MQSSALYSVHGIKELRLEGCICTFKSVNGDVWNIRLVDTPACLVHTPCTCDNNPSECKRCDDVDAKNAVKHALNSIKGIGEPNWWYQLVHALKANGWSYDA